MDHENHFYVSEPNLQLIFQPGIAKKGTILLENINPISEEYITELKSHFYKGYQAGLSNFKEELGPTYNSLSIAHQQEMLVAFITECHEYLYFEGFAIPQALFSLGYIQANLVLSYKEYQNIKELTKQSLTELKPAEPTQSPKLKELISNTNYPKIGIKYFMSDIINLWMVLLDIHQCHSQALIQEFKSEKEIKTLLGSIFIDLSNKHSLLPDAPHRLYELPQNYQVILNLLMHATYKLNYTYTNLKLSPYAKLLKDTFSTYGGIEVDYIGSNITKKLNDAISIIQALQDSSRAKNAIEILKKIPQYDHYFKRR